MNRNTLLAAASIVVLSASLSHARPAISVVGNGKVDADFIVSSFPDSPSYRDSDIDAAIKSLFSTGAFSDIRVDRKGKGYLVTVEETPVVVSVSFKGNERLKDEQLVGKAALDSGTPFDPSRLSEVSARLEAAYAATGRRNARVKAEVVNRDGGFYDVTFDIDEGERSETTDIWFDGNKSFSGRKLRSVMSTKETGIVTKLFSKDVLDTDRLETDRRRLEAFYRSKGYTDVVVSEAEVDFDPDGKKGMVGFRIEEGPCYAVGNIEIENTTDIEVPAPLIARTKAMSSKVYDEASSARLADEIAREMEADGSFPVSVKVRPSRQANGVMDVAYTVDKADRVYVERIEIVGNDQTKDYVIRREIDLSEGDLFNIRIVREAERRMKRLDFFESVRIASTKGSADDRVVLRVEVTERKTGEFTIGGAYSTTDGPMAILSLSQSNFGGTGRAVSASVGQGTKTGNYDFSFTEPYVFGHRISATAQLFRRDYDVREGGFRPYKETVDGARLSLKGPLSANSDLSVYYSIANSSKEDMASGFAGVVSAEDRLVSSLGYDWSWNDLDDEADPANGFKFGFGQQFAGLGGDARFIKTEASARAYRELSQRHEIIGSVAVKAGHIAGIGQDLAFEDHFRAPGELVRGFEAGGFGPRDAASGYLLGGQYYAGASAEAIYPIPVLSDGVGIKGSIFADIGTIWGADKGRASATGSSVVFDDIALRASIGTGVVWDSPLGLLKANFAIPVSKEEGDRTQVFSISGGTRF